MYYLIIRIYAGTTPERIKVRRNAYANGSIEAYGQDQFVGYSGSSGPCILRGCGIIGDHSQCARSRDRLGAELRSLFGMSIGNVLRLHGIARYGEVASNLILALDK